MFQGGPASAPAAKRYVRRNEKRKTAMVRRAIVLCWRDSGPPRSLKGSGAGQCRLTVQSTTRNCQRHLLARSRIVSATFEELTKREQLHLGTWSGPMGGERRTRRCSRRS